MSDASATLRAAAEHFRRPAANDAQRKMADQFESWAAVADGDLLAVRDRIDVRNAVNIALSALRVDLRSDSSLPVDGETNG